MPGPSKKIKLSLGSKDTTHLLYDSLFSILKHIILAILVGSLAWGFTRTLEISINKSTHFLFASFHHQDKKKTILPPRLVSPPINEKKITIQHQQLRSLWIFLIIIIAGALVRSLLIQSKTWKTTEGDGATDSILYFLESYKIFDQPIIKERYKRPCFTASIRRVIMTIITLGCGGSGGLEGPAIPIGEGIGSGISRTLKIINPDTLRALQMAGIAAAICTLLDAPFASAIFAAEVVFSERIIYRSFLYSIFAVIVSYSLNRHFTHDNTLFTITAHTQPYSLYEYLSVCFVAIFCSAPAGFGLRWFFTKLQQSFNHLHITLRALLGALFTACIVLILWFILGIEPQHVIGTGEHTIANLLHQDGNPLLKIWWILFIIILAKTLTTGFTLMAGGSAGILFPAMVLGGTMGAGMYHLLLTLSFISTPNPDLFIVSGIASGLVAVIEAPLASIAFVIELFGASFAPPAMIAVAICHLLAHNLRIYSNKKRLNSL